ALAGAGCTALDSALAEVPFLSFMQKSPAPPPYGMPRAAPPGSIPSESPAGQVFPGLQPNETSLTAFGAAHPNPVPRTDVAGLKTGQALFERYCFVCHGPLGKGDGPILNNFASKDPAQQSGKFPFAPNLMLPTTVARADGYIFAIITVGRGLMPEYGSKIPAPERWYVVNYLRTLQQAAGAAAAAGATPPGATTPGATTPATAPAAAPSAPAAPTR
ncbi:MAG TPA: cytochrome c, partial [Longimicrobiales bacterium]